MISDHLELRSWMANAPISSTPVKRPDSSVKNTPPARWKGREHYPFHRGNKVFLTHLAIRSAPEFLRYSAIVDAPTLSVLDDIYACSDSPPRKVAVHSVGAVTAVPLPIISPLLIEISSTACAGSEPAPINRAPALAAPKTDFVQASTTTSSCVGPQLRRLDFANITAQKLRAVDCSPESKGCRSDLVETLEIGKGVEPPVPGEYSTGTARGRSIRGGQSTPSGGVGITVAPRLA